MIELEHASDIQEILELSPNSQVKGCIRHLL